MGCFRGLPESNQLHCSKVFGVYAGKLSLSATIWLWYNFSGNDEDIADWQKSGETHSLRFVCAYFDSYEDWAIHLKDREVKPFEQSQIKSIVEEMVKPFLEENGFELVDIEYVKEGSNWFLRVLCRQRRRHRYRRLRPDQRIFEREAG